MSIFIYIVAGIFIVLPIGGIYSYTQTKHRGLLIGSLVAIGFSVLAIVLVRWWPLIAGFAALWGLRLLGLDPSSPR